MDNNYEDIFDDVFEKRKPDFTKTINIAFIGKVSTGKSSLLNAILERPKSDPIATVSAMSGATTEIKSFKLDEHVLIIDSPGLDDIKKENSHVTENFIENIDLGLFVITGSADQSQKNKYLELKSKSKKTFVILNKIDEWDDLEPSALEDVIEQWKNTLGAGHIYPTCTKGYDPKSRKDLPLDLRGVDALQEDIFHFLRKEGKEILLARHLGDKRKYAAGIIATALGAVAAEAFIPGSAAYITATQAIAITSLHYLYTGTALSKGSALALIPTFIGQSLGTTAFLWAKSFLPPTGVVDAAAAGIAVIITFAMLASVTYILSNGYSLDDRSLLKEKFAEYKNSSGSDLKASLLSAIKGKDSLSGIIYKSIFR